MDRLIAIAVFTSIALLGFITLFRDLRRNRRRAMFANEFLSQFRALLKNQEIDYEIYTWLIHRSPKLQAEMGGHGIVHSFRPPYSNYMYKSYPIILNVIPEIRKEIEDDKFMRNVRVINAYIALVNESLIRYIGSLDDALDELRREIKNPVIWLREGFSFILLLPISFFYWLGIVGSSFVEKISRNPIFKIIAGLITLLGSISTVMAIVMGWDSFVQTIMDYLASSP